jgi:hypothetical protein
MLTPLFCCYSNTKVAPRHHSCTQHVLCQLYAWPAHDIFCCATACVLSLSAGVSGPIAFDSKGDLVPHDGVYVRVTFDPKTGDMVMGDPIDLPDN